MASSVSVEWTWILRPRFLDVVLRRSGFGPGLMRYGCGSKFEPPGYGPQVLVHVSFYQGKPFGVPIFDPQPYQ